MHATPTALVLDPDRHSPTAPLKLLVLALTSLVMLFSANNTRAQNLDSEPLLGSVSLEAGFSSTPYTVEVSPGGEDGSAQLGDNCFGYIRFAQPDFVLSYRAGENPLGIFAVSDLDITIAINDPAGNWHCNDDSPYLSDTNSGIQFSDPLSGDYQIWVGSYDSGAESITTLLAITEADETEWASLPVGLEDSVYAANFDLNGDIIFGDDSSGFANEGECDDPRFQGPGAAFGSSSSHLFKDASDCRSQFQAGMVTLAEPEDMNLSGDFGSGLIAGDASLFPGNTVGVNPASIADAGPFGEVMSALWQAFQAIPGDNAPATPLPFELGGNNLADYDRNAMTALTGINFGENSGPFIDDGECDDPRFEGPGASGIDFEGGELTDAADCSSLYLEGSLTYLEPGIAEPEMIVDSNGINFGDNSSVYADDGECDDPRFEGPGAASFNSEDDEMHDANDCRSLYEAGRVRLLEGISNRDSSASLSSSARSNSAAGNTPAAPQQETYTVGVPRGDVNGATQAYGSIYASGTVYGSPINPGERGLSFMPDVTSYAPPPTRPEPEIDFGDNSSVFANDGECDDPRFEGEGMAFASFDEYLGRDADDCRTAFEAGTITLIRDEQP
ncbi:MAG: hypothetical protein O2948_11245 [Proteobacteria bacterium]|nr:hypothetical protein [Pseudomonadota bacterium]